jgi:hypothetical protein
MKRQTSLHDGINYSILLLAQPIRLMPSTRLACLICAGLRNTASTSFRGTLQTYRFVGFFRGYSVIPC